MTNIPRHLFNTYHIGHFLNQPHTTVDFAITQLETMQEPDVDDWHKHTFYEILWIEQGRTTQIVDYQEYTIADNTLFFISPGQLHYFEAWQGLRGLTIMFTEEFVLLNRQNQEALFELTYLDTLGVIPFLQLSPAHIAQLVPMMRLLEQEYARDDASWRIKQGLLQALLSGIQRCVNEQPRYESIPNRYWYLFKQFKQLLEAHFSDNLRVSDYAERLAITQHHLNRIAQSITHKTASALIRARVVLEAKRLLNFSDLTVNEIAFRLGFEEASYFARVFRQETGASPMEFKIIMSQKYHD